MTPWRKRLRDYAQLVIQASDTYFNPDTFRLNVNNAIQTARTVTFIIQKHKSSIPDFDSWYVANVIDVFKQDPVMEWLKDSRNFIEKQGDLEINSASFLQFLLSYWDPGPKISLKNEGLLFAGMKKLVRFGQKNLPTGVFRDSAIVVERRWVANSFPSMELTDALQHGFVVLRRVVDALDDHIQAPREVTTLPAYLPIGSRTRRAYVKINDGKTYLVSTESRKRDDAATEEELTSRYGHSVLKNMYSREGDFQKAFARAVEVACHMFNTDGYHVTIGFLLDQQFLPRRLVSVQFADHTEKFIFWSRLADELELDQESHAIIFVSEYWMRSAKGREIKPVENLEILGEGLHIVGLSADGAYLSKRFRAVASSEGKRLGPEEIPDDSTFPNFLVPIARVWGLEELVKAAMKQEVELLGRSKHAPDRRRTDPT